MTSVAVAADSPSPELVEKSNACKALGNELFKGSKYSQAIQAYTDGISILPTAVLYSNRSFCFLKTESFGLAIADAKSAIGLDSTYVKAHYRLASAQLALGKVKQAYKIFRAVCKLRPKDKDARKKMKYCDSELKRAAFEKAIASEKGATPSQTLDISKIEVPGSYDGPKWEGDKPITLEFVKEMIEHMRSQKVLHRKYTIKILLECIKYFKKLPSLVDVSFGGEGGDAAANPDAKRFNVCGDTHGQYYDVLNIFEINGMPSPENPYLFNGDFVDRGSFSVEVVMTFFAFKLLYPKSFYMARGNHETVAMNKVYGFTGEVKHKYDDNVMGLFTEVFQWLPLAHVINQKVFVVHGGLFKDENVKLDDIRKVVRNREPPESGIMSDILWADPQPFKGRGPSKRGVGLSFGPDVTAQFLADNGLEMVVRSHEVRDEGFLVEHDGKLVTIFSAPNYCDQMGNKGGIIHFTPDMKPTYVKFTAVAHPPIRPMAYAGNMFGF
jgi:serine/threonine-protein phosphatase 5